MTARYVMEIPLMQDITDGKLVSVMRIKNSDSIQMFCMWNRSFRYGDMCKITYALGCGLNDGDKAGTVTIDRQVSEQNYKLTPAVGGTAGCISNVSCSPSSYQVTSNGSYSFTVNYTDSGVSKSVSVSCTISDYDGTAPVINSVTASTTAETTGSVSLSVNATDNVGITAYRMNGGSWQSGSTFP